MLATVIATCPYKALIRDGDPIKGNLFIGSPSALALAQRAVARWVLGGWCRTISRIAPTFSWIGQLCPVRNQVWRLMFRSARSAQKRHCDGSMPRLRMASVLKERPSAAIDMRAVLDTADIEHPVVLERAECDAVIAAARHTPAFELEPQRL